VVARFQLLQLFWNSDLASFLRLVLMWWSHRFLANHISFVVLISSLIFYIVINIVGPVSYLL
jgi:hypothetical protein